MTRRRIALLATGSVGVVAVVLVILLAGGGSQSPPVPRADLGYYDQCVQALGFRSPASATASARDTCAGSARMEAKTLAEHATGPTGPTGYQLTGILSASQGRPEFEDRFIDVNAWIGLGSGRAWWVYAGALAGVRAPRDAITPAVAVYSAPNYNAAEAFLGFFRAPLRRGLELRIDAAGPGRLTLRSSDGATLAFIIAKQLYVGGR